MHDLRPSAAEHAGLFCGFAALLTALVLTIGIASGAGRERASPPPELAAELQTMIERDGAPGVTVLVFRKARMLYRIDAGAIDPDAQLPVASASKWIAAALVMSVVDEGLLSLDEPIGRRLPAFHGEAGRITLRQILSYTSGQGGLSGLADLRQDPRMSLADSARDIAHIPLTDRPGTIFRYGSPAFQVAGALVEQATGKSWTDLFEEKLARPLGMTRSYWANPLWPDVPRAQIRNPNLQGGLVTTAADYGKFLTMLASQGLYAGRRILSAEAVDLMERDQTAGARMAFAPAGAKGGLRYGFGNWCEALDDNRRCTMVSSPGALGTYPWIDRQQEIYGLFFMRRRLPFVEREIQAARRSIIEAAQAARSHHL